MQALSSRHGVRAFTSGPALAPRRCSVVVAVKPTKAEDFKSLTTEEMFNRMAELKTELATSRFLARTRGITELQWGEAPQPSPDNVPKAHIYKHLRRQVAQMWTVLRAREIVEGVSIRESRRRHVKESVALLSKNSLSIRGRARK
eukprot:CAMPEP_0119103644 /NCGR_PEP_ID=MMETSP1180-20130426/2040_1 /TAXON_ID=3052 ORGANISM="Chlamydomonas cf sp, Strain CCMP681" /NCGR_SAMPLE_ID=MMETSP1180 /ASSEMBLY_ACC=CAM_ASM_000741 /LENGTH=144 /DNA_ID=CAMNT_0007088203 /DNA_START=44 /DNA_END=478 /DNA_ORIENTATION=-